MRMSLAVWSVLALLSLPGLAQTAEPAAAPAQSSTDTDIQLLRSDVQAAKKDIITHTMVFTDAESAAFWPLYGDYARDQQAIGDTRVKLIKDYLQNYDSMDDTKAKDMVQRMLSIDRQTLKLREDYWPKFMNALGAKRAAKFYQVDNRLSLLVNLQLSDNIPLIP